MHAARHRSDRPAAPGRRPARPWRGARRASGMLLGALWLAFLAAPAQAHGGLHTRQIDGAEVGPYRVSVWTGPNVLRPGAVLIEALVADPATDAPAEGVAVRYTVAPAGSLEAMALELSAEPIVAPSERDREELLHIAIGNLTTPGDYRVTVHVSDADGFAGTVGFDVEVLHDNPAFRIVLNVLVVLTVLIAAAFIWHTLRRAHEIMRR